MNKKIKYRHLPYSSIFVTCMLFYSCSSSTCIQTSQGAAKLYINNEYKGTTPYVHTDTRIVGSTLVLKLEKEGYKPLITTITKDEEIDPGAIAGGIFFGVPFLWTMRYHPNHIYELVKLPPEIDTISDEGILKQKAPVVIDKFTQKIEKLRELKKLLDEKIITQSEFDKEKARILALPD